MTPKANLCVFDFEFFMPINLFISFIIYRCCDRNETAFCCGYFMCDNGSVYFVHQIASTSESVCRLYSVYKCGDRVSNRSVLLY